MKKIIPYLISIFIIAILAVIFISFVKQEHIVVIKEGNHEHKALPITLGKYQDSDCGMIVESLEFACQFSTPDGKTRFFHDIGGMANYLKSKSYKDDIVAWVYTKDTQQWIDAKSAFYTTNEVTPMSYGFGAYEKAQEKSIDYAEMFLRVERGETLQDPRLRKKALGY